VHSFTKLNLGTSCSLWNTKDQAHPVIKGVDKLSERITHDGIYLGDGKILQTYSKDSGGVRIDSIEGTHWEKRFLFGGSPL
jgi:hypothetical protein